MLDVPQADKAIVFGHSPWSCLWCSIKSEADFQPSIHAAGVGTVRVSTE
jgi:hypothetical protein